MAKSVFVDETPCFMHLKTFLSTWPKSGELQSGELQSGELQTSTPRVPKIAIVPAYSVAKQA